MLVAYNSAGEWIERVDAELVALQYAIVILGDTVAYVPYIALKIIIAVYKDSESLGLFIELASFSI